MAVTQKLLRISSDKASAAAASEGKLDQIIGVVTDALDEGLDLDWAPKPLKDALISLGHLDLAASVVRACEGAEILNRIFPEGPDTYRVYSEIRINDSRLVQELANDLARLPLGSLQGVATELLPTVTDPGSYLQGHASKLAAFYARAASAQQVVVTWWD